MIVEFVGSSGAGKTTLVTEVQRRLAGQAQVVTSFELTAGLVGLRRVTHPTVRNLVQDLVGLPFFFASLHRHRDFVAFALKAVVRQSGSLFLAANYVRSIVRKIGMYEIGRRYAQHRIVLVDEGTVLSAHLLYVFTLEAPDQEQIERFASLVPLPDRVVCIQAPLESLVERARLRSDAPREMRSKDEEEVEEVLGRAAELFDRLAMTERIGERVLIVDNPASTEDERRMVAGAISRFILNYKATGRPAPRRPAGWIESVSMVGEKSVS